jgi:hypothetical protein
MFKRPSHRSDRQSWCSARLTLMDLYNKKMSIRNMLHRHTIERDAE